MRLWTILAIGVLSLLSAIGGVAPFTSQNTMPSYPALSADDVHPDWTASEFDDVLGEALWGALPSLLTSDSGARLRLTAFESPNGLRGTCTLLVETDRPAALPSNISSEWFNGGTCRRISRILSCHRLAKDFSSGHRKSSRVQDPPTWKCGR